MKNIKKLRKTRFSKIVRIKPEQLKYLKKAKDTRTIAGFLDKLINIHRNHVL